MTRQGWLTLTMLIGAAALVGGDARALSDEEIFRSFQFNFVNPGARAVGLGGAFIAAADDATAAQANPAALHYVSRNEFFAEYRADRPKATVFEPTGGTQGSLDLADLDLPYLSLQAFNDPDDQANVSFVSFVLPFEAGKARMRLALSRQVVLDVKTSLGPEGATSLSYSAETFPIWVNPSSGQVEQYRIENTVVGDLDAEIVHYNLGFSTSITQDFSIGATATYATLDASSFVTSNVTDPRGLLTFTNPRVDLDGDGSLENVALTTSIDGSDSNWTYSVGLHWHPDLAFPSGVSPIKFGFVYRHGARLAVQELVSEIGSDGVPTVTDEFENVFKVPDRFGLGVSYEYKRWTFALDLERIQYSDLLEGFRPGVNLFTSGRIGGADLGIQPGATPEDFKYTVDDATVVRLGTEYTFTSRGAWSHSLRLGYYNAPDSRIRLEDFPSDGSAQGEASEQLFLDVFRGGEDFDHYTVGFGIGHRPLGRQETVMSVAGDFADSGSSLIVSLLWRF